MSIGVWVRTVKGRSKLLRAAHPYKPGTPVGISPRTGKAVLSRDGIKVYGHVECWVVLPITVKRRTTKEILAKVFEMIHTRELLKP